MIDKEIINKHLAELDKIVTNLKRHQHIELNVFKNNNDLIWAIEHGLQLAIQNIIDIGGHILAAIGENNINDYSDIIKKLGEKNIIPEIFANKIYGMAGFRNILIHEYIKIDIEKVYNSLRNNLDDFITFAKYIKNYLITIE